MWFPMAEKPSLSGKKAAISHLNYCLGEVGLVCLVSHQHSQKTKKGTFLSAHLDKQDAGLQKTSQGQQEMEATSAIGTQEDELGPSRCNRATHSMTELTSLHVDEEH